MRTLLIGDTHGDTRFAIQVCDAARNADVQTMIQLGDWDLGLNQTFRQTWVNWLEEDDARRYFWLDGNHDDHAYIRDVIMVDADYFHPVTHWHERMYYCPRGSVTKLGGTTIMFVGGAASIDKHHRTPGVDWWPQEDLTDGQAAFAIKNGYDVDVILSHDCPDTVWFGDKLANGNYKIDRSSENNRKRLTQIVHTVGPHTVYHGHYHQEYQTELEARNGTCRVVGLGANVAHTIRGVKSREPIFGDNIVLVDF